MVKYSLLTIALALAVSSVEGRVHKVYPGDSIQEAIDEASSGDVIQVRPGVYSETSNTKYGLRIVKDNIKIIGVGGRGGSVRLLAINQQEVGVYAAPEGCEYEDNECQDTLNVFSIKGISVESFPKNGIQTRWVDGFEFIKCYSVDNMKNGIYPTLSSNGIVNDCTSHGSLDAGIWIAGSQNVTATDNQVYNSVTGFEVTVSNKLYVANNRIYNNVVGLGLYHPNMAGTNPGYPSFDDWVFENNQIYENNLPNTAPPGSFQGALVSGVGVLLVGISGHTIQDNSIKGNDWAGVLVAGYCTVRALAFGDLDCSDPPKNGDPSANFNTIANNVLSENGSSPPTTLGLPGADILYGQSAAEIISSEGDQNCFANNTAPDGTDASSIALDIPLPDAGCN